MAVKANVQEEHLNVINAAVFYRRINSNIIWAKQIWTVSWLFLGTARWSSVQVVSKCPMYRRRDSNQRRIYESESESFIFFSKDHLSDCSAVHWEPLFQDRLQRTPPRTCMTSRLCNTTSMCSSWTTFSSSSAVDCKWVVFYFAILYGIQTLSKKWSWALTDSCDLKTHENVPFNFRTESFVNFALVCHKPLRCSRKPKDDYEWKHNFIN